MKQLVNLICPDRWIFPMFGRCKGILSLRGSDSATQAQQGIHEVALDQDSVNNELSARSPSVGSTQDGSYVRKLHVCTLSNGYVTHQGGYITAQGRLIEELSQYFDYAITEHRYLHSLRLFRKIETIKRPVIALAGAGQYNYCHWWIDIMPKLHLIRAYGEGVIDPLYYVETSKPFQREILGFLGISSTNCLNSREHQIIRASQVLAASPRTPSQNPDRWLVNWLRQTFLPFAKPPVNEARCVVVSRRDAKTRAVVNEAEMLECLRPLRPVVIELEKLTVAEQMGYFARAQWIIAPHGAGLTNLIFASPDAHVVELFGSTKINDCYRLLAAKVGCRHTCLLGEDVVDSKTGENHIRANLAQLKSTLIG